jgi:MFS family permease
VQPERQISVALVGIGAALVIPELAALSRSPDATPGANLVVGGVLGALGVFLGTLLASDHAERSARVLGLAIWTLAGIAFSGPVLLGALGEPGWGGRTIFGLAAILPLLGPVVVLARRDKA